MMVYVQRCLTWILPCFLLLVGCAAQTPGARGRADPLACGSPNDGPLIQVTVDPRPVGPPTGGAIADGVYDLVAMVATEGDARHGSQLTGSRLRMTFVTDQRASDHIEGRTLAIGGQVPRTECETGRFATFGTTLRFSGAKKSLDGAAYSVTRDGFIVYVDSAHGRLDPSYIVFRRRE